MGREAFIRRIENSDEFKIFDKLVNQADASLEDAIQQVVNESTAENPTDPHQGFSDVDYEVSLALIELSQRLEPAKHRRLVEFMAEYQKFTVRDPSTGETLKAHGETLWADLPSFAYTELETWCEFGGDYKDPDDSKMKPEQQQRWIKFNAFIAQVTQAAKVDYASPDCHPMDKSLRAIWTMQKGLEHAKNPPQKLVEAPAMRAACMWFIYAGERLWANVMNGRVFVRDCGAGPGQKYEGREWNGFERERWDAWEGDLRESRDACTEEGMKELIGDALEHMKSARGND